MQPIDEGLFFKEEKIKNPAEAGLIILMNIIDPTIACQIHWLH
jgi:hypothetical protein